MSHEQMPGKKRSRTSTFSEILISLMDERKMSVRAAAALAEVGPSTVNSWRSGAYPEDYEAVRKLANAFGVTLSFLLTGREENPSSENRSVMEVFSEGDTFFDGFAKVTIRRLVPRKKF